MDPTLLRFDEAATRKLGEMREAGRFDGSALRVTVEEEGAAFHYRIEVYVPAPQRTFGYYTLPLLVDGQLIGRVDQDLRLAHQALANELRSNPLGRRKQHQTRCRQRTDHTPRNRRHPGRFLTVGHSLPCTSYRSC